MEAQIAALRAKLEQLDIVIRGDGNGRVGLSARIATLEKVLPELIEMLDEWKSSKDQLKGARTALVIVIGLLTAFGGGLGIAILQALRQLIQTLP